MARPIKCRQISFKPIVDYFKPRGIPLMDLKEIKFSLVEFEAIRLKDLEGLDQEKAAKLMKVSRPTFTRIYSYARKKIADALIKGKALKIEGGIFKLKTRLFRCLKCNNEWEEPFGTGRPIKCPKCKDENIRRVK